MQNQDKPPSLDEVVETIKSRFTGQGSGSSGGAGSSGGGPAPDFTVDKRALGAAAAILAVVYVVTGFYQVDPQSQAVVLRLGVYHETNSPGLHWNPPVIDRTYIENVTAVRNYSDRASMLTADENIVTVEWTVQYRIADVKDFVLNVRVPPELLRLATDSALRHEVGSNKLDDILSVGRDALASATSFRIQSYIDDYGTGLELTKINIARTAAPPEVQEAFDDVIRAREDKQRLVNEAEAYANRIVPVARGEAQRMLAEADAYKSEVVEASKGEADRFLLLLAEYRKYPEVTRKRLYLEHLTSVYSRVPKILVDSGENQNLLYLPLDRMRANAQGSGLTAAAGEIGNAVTNNSNLNLNELAELIADKLASRFSSAAGSSRVPAQRSSR